MARKDEADGNKSEGLEVATRGLPFPISRNNRIPIHRSFYQHSPDSATWLMGLILSSQWLNESAVGRGRVPEKQAAACLARMPMPGISRDVNRLIEMHAKMLEQPWLDSAERWELERLIAVWHHELSVREYYEQQGVAFVDHHQWDLDRQLAVLAYMRLTEGWRKRRGDRQILERLSELQGKSREEGDYKITRSRRRVIGALVRLASGSGVLYCGYDGLARKAGVSPRSACSIRAELERLGVLVRVRTGGKAADGFCRSNKYYVSWNTLRDVLGVENVRASRYIEPALPGRDSLGRNVYYSYEGCAHYSKSERQRRRLRARERKGARSALAEASARRPRWLLGDVEKRSNSGDAIVDNQEYMPGDLKSVPNDQALLDFCAVTGLKNNKDLCFLQLERPPLLIEGQDVDKCTPQRGALGARPADGKSFGLCFNPGLFAESTRKRLAAVHLGRFAALLSEADQMTRDNPMLETSEDMQWHAEQVLLLIMDADKSLFNR